ncbi:hypothetical protein ZEAMMB73_Zm00001d041509 [Zea mays]|uniref:Uncharacterized protein n=1 Tax=Zea mays TaxID=4577 RepID=A0A1D6MWM2_MAIZE|nr:hypothetical protein ZEAMMB73_Zm00001d041509 [Zea mays]
MRRCVRQTPAQPPLGRGPERLHRAVHRQTWGPHGCRQCRRLSGCSGHRNRRRCHHAVQLIIHLKPNPPVYYLADEPMVQFIWQPSQESSYSPCRARSTTTISRIMASSRRRR